MAEETYRGFKLTALVAGDAGAGFYVQTLTYENELQGVRVNDSLRNKAFKTEAEAIAGAFEKLRGTVDSLLARATVMFDQSRKHRQ